MEFRSIRCFICVAELGSISRAAEQLGIVQPALTRHIQRLEEEFGTVLLTRQPRGVRLTAAGREFLEHCRRIEEEVARAKHELTAQGQQPRGPIAFGATPTLGTVLMPAVVEQALVEFPHIQLRVVESRSIRLHESLLTGALDLAILTNPVGSHSLNLQPLVSEPLCLVEKAERAGSRPAGARIELDALTGIPVVVTPGMRALASGDYGTRKIRLAVAAEIESIETIRWLVRAGRARTIVPASAFHEDIQAGLLRAHPIDAPDRQRVLVLATRSDSAELPAVRELSRIVRTEVRQRIAGGALAFLS